MSEASEVAEHYSSRSLLDRIEAALAKAGAKRPLDLETLALFDEFHIGGRQATEHLLKRLDISAGNRVLDLGCGLGGPARYVSKVSTARVTGLDLTEDFVTAGNALTGQALMVDLVDLRQGSILDMPFDDDQFDVAYMIHVGMNIADKAALAAEVARVLKPGSLFGIYDVMAVDEPELTFPVPWASGPEQNALSAPQVYRDALTGAGFRVLSETDRTEFARAFFARLSDQQSRAASPPVLGLHLVMGPDTATKIRNMVAALHGHQIAPVEMIARVGF
ncbi:class I SAM-dependent methyltransferase [Sedimentitalea todarodis]|uniref:Methyltransferase domain-containing protein n=1 Tax=Sedimentitalea todarodis TaxID=1631240 RepID=A0ABU3V8J6_9RHOB|nr:methyltransferase domain-containing protein [Sedimentitalea todarodis]MDU9002428.1 methyltransferase domain-containing protein [Sedimentitalea todarodis]